MLKSLYKRVFSEKKRIDFIYSYYKLRSLWYRGDHYYCNCCRKAFRAFLPKGNIPRPNAQCPYCGSLERTRLLLLYLENETNYFERNVNVLHIAPERCLSDLFRKLDWGYVDGDINPALASYIVDLTSVGYPDQYFDLILCSHVLGHIPDERKAVQEMYRVLKPGGLALILSLIDKKRMETLEDHSLQTESERLQAYGEPDLCRLHGLDFKQRLTEGGFCVTEIDYRLELTVDVNRRLSLGNGERELIWHCERKD